MVYILAGIMSLPQYLEQYHDDKIDRLAHCPATGSGFN